MKSDFTCHFRLLWQNFCSIALKIRRNQCLFNDFRLFAFYEFWGAEKSCKTRQKKFLSPSKTAFGASGMHNFSIERKLLPSDFIVSFPLETPWSRKNFRRLFYSWIMKRTIEISGNCLWTISMIMENRSRINITHRTLLATLSSLNSPSKL